MALIPLLAAEADEGLCPAFLNDTGETAGETLSQDTQQEVSQRVEEMRELAEEERSELQPAGD